MGRLGIVASPNSPVEYNFIHCDEVRESNLVLLKSDKYCDLAFQVGEEKKEIKCHKLFLISRSPIFAAMFTQKLNTSDPIALPDVEPESFLLFLRFLYGDAFTTRISIAVKLLQVASMFDVQPLIRRCEDLMSQNVQLGDAIETFKVARRHSLSNLMEQAGDVITSSFPWIMEDASFRNVDEDILVYLLRRNDLLVPEITLFNIVFRWASENIGENTSHSDVFKKFLPLIRFPVMTAEEFATSVFPKQILPQKTVVDLFLYFNSAGTIREDIAKRLEYSTCRRQRNLVIDIYEDSCPEKFTPDFGTLGHWSDVEEILEISFENVKSKGQYDSKVLKLSSLLLQGRNYDSVQEYLPVGFTSESNKIKISVEKVSANGRATPVFTRECEISSGSDVELTLRPLLEVSADCKYEIKVKCQDIVIVKRPGQVGPTGQSNIDPREDLLNHSRLKSSFSVSNFTVNMSMKASNDRDYYTKYYRGFLNLHFVRGLKLLVQA